MPPVKEQMNLNTWIALVGFAITVGGGYGTYSSFRADTEAWKLQVASQVADLNTRLTENVAQMTARSDEFSRDINALNVQDARQMEQIAAMLVYLQRIEHTLDILVKGTANEP